MKTTIGLSLFFAKGTRPSAGDVERLLATSGHSAQTARIVHRPPEDQGWLELLASGLTFDLCGLAPGPTEPIPPVGHAYGLPADIDTFDLETISLAPGGHIAAGGALMPVVRVMLGLAASLSFELPVLAVCWNPAQSWMEPRYFSRVVVTWLSGGGFPALGLTRLAECADGALESAGLAYFTGQELRIPHLNGAPGPETVQLAGRIIDHLVRHGPLDRAAQLAGPHGEALIAEPSSDGRYVMVARTG